MDIYKGQNALEFTQSFKTEEDCKKYLSQVKWSKGFTCRKCGHQGSQIRKNYSRTCNKCSYTESPSAGTLFHRVKFGLLKAFNIYFEMTTTTESLVVLQVERRYAVRPQTARLFMNKVREAMKTSEGEALFGPVEKN